MKQVINTPQAPAPIGPYNQAIVAGNTLYISGQIAIDPASGELVMQSLEEEAHQVMKNLKAIVDAAGFSMRDIVKCTIFILDMSVFGTINTVYGSYFDADPPARETVAVAGLPKGVRVEISAIAVKA